jgi:hypothetical protein
MSPVNPSGNSWTTYNITKDSIYSINKRKHESTIADRVSQMESVRTSRVSIVGRGDLRVGGCTFTSCEEEAKTLFITMMEAFFDHIR